MTISFVREFLRQGLIQGLDEADYDRLTAATEVTKSRLEDNYPALRRYCTALLDENVADTDSVIVEIQLDIEEVWKTFAGKYQTPPIPILRAVGLQAMVDIAEADSDTIKPMLWFTGSTLIERMMLGREADLLRKLFQKWGEATEDLAASQWQSTDILTRPVNVTLDKTAIAKLGTDAFGVEETTALTAVQLAPVLLKITQGLSALVNHNTGQLTKSLSEALTQGLQQIAQNEKQRVDLLWWKQTLYSPSRRTGYHEIRPHSVQIFSLAYDLHLQLPPLYPQSVEYLLRETVNRLSDEQEIRPFTVGEFVTELTSDPNVVGILTQLKRNHSGRVPLLEFMASVSCDQTEVDRATLRVGLPGDLELSASAFAVWVLRELTAHRLSTSSSPEGIADA